MATQVARPNSSFGVFKPSNKPLVVRSTLADVFDNSTKKKKRAAAQRSVATPALPPLESNLNLPTVRNLGAPPPTLSPSPRFGSYSQASFFSRHNPHPSRVRHIKGLNGIPICAVHDQGYFPVQRFSVGSLSPSRQDNLIRKHLPPNALGINSTTFPIDTITGIQNYPFKEKAVPGIGLIPVIDSWKSELKELCTKAGLVSPINEPPLLPPKPASASAPRKTVYSSQSGRIIPPASRMSTRMSSRQSLREMQFNHISSYPDSETIMLEMLCQILQTDSVPAVQQWLVSAGDREKGLVLDVIKAAIEEEDQIQTQQAVPVPPIPQTPLPNIPAERAISRMTASRASLRSAQRPLGSIRKAPTPEVPATPTLRYSKSAEASRPLSVMEEVDLPPLPEEPEEEEE